MSIRWWPCRQSTTKHEKESKIVGFDAFFVLWPYFCPFPTLLKPGPAMLNHRRLALAREVQ